MEVDRVVKNVAVVVVFVVVIVVVVFVRCNMSLQSVCVDV
jgi:hypothetical protein